MDIYGTQSGYRTTVQKQMDEETESPRHFRKNSNFFNSSSEYIDDPRSSIYYETLQDTNRRITAQSRKRRSQIAKKNEP